MILAIAGIALELAVAPAWFAKRSLPIPLGLHLAATASFAGALLIGMAREGRTSSTAARLYAVFIIGFFPCVGLPAAAFMMACVTGLGKRLKSGLYEDYERYITQEQPGRASAAKFENLLREVRDEVSFEPFIDIIRGYDLRIKVKVIEKLSQEVSRHHVTLLKEAIKDPAPEIRFTAAGALLKAEDEVNRNIDRAMKVARQRGTAQDFADLAGLYRRYAESGLLEERLALYYLSFACDAYQSSLDLNTDQPETFVQYARCLILLGRNERAKETLDRAVRLWPAHAELSFLRAEVCFKSGQIAEVHRSLVAVKPEGLGEAEKEVLQFWTNAP